MVWVFIGGGMSGILHRFFAHRAFKTSPAFACVLGLLGTLGNQAGVLWWASKHNRHHKFCDTPKDPHSWTHSSELYAWFGWIYFESKTDWQFVAPVYKENWGLVALNELQPLVLLAWYAGLHATIGFDWALWAIWVPSIISLVGTLRFNLDFHPASHPDHSAEAKKEGACKGLDRGHWVGWLLGESNHDDHHKSSRRAHRPSLDLPYHLFLSPLAFAGIIWDLEPGLELNTKQTAMQGGWLPVFSYIPACVGIIMATVVFPVIVIVSTST